MILTVKNYLKFNHSFLIFTKKKLYITNQFIQISPSISLLLFSFQKLLFTLTNKLISSQGGTDDNTTRY